MRCFEICFGRAPFRFCYRVCIPNYWPLSLVIDPPDPWGYVGLTVDGEHPEWLRDVHALAAAQRGAELATGEVAKILGAAVERAAADVQARMPEGATLTHHEHAQATA